MNVEKQLLKKAPRKVRTSSSGSIGYLSGRREIREEIDNLTLPEKSKPLTNIGDFTYLIYGERGIGKTTLASQFEDPFFLMFEPGGRALHLRQVNVPTWAHFLKYIDLILQNPNYCRTVVIDTGFMAYERCFEHMLRKFNITDPQDESWGNGWKLIDKEFRDRHFDIINAGFGIIIIAHTEEREIKARVGKDWKVVGSKLTMQLGKQAMRLYKAIIDLEGYYHIDWKGDRERVLQILPSETVECKNKIKGHFLYTDGSKMESIPMGYNEEDAYINFEKAFNNQWTKQETRKGEKTTLIRRK